MLDAIICGKKSSKRQAEQSHTKDSQKIGDQNILCEKELRFLKLWS